MKVVYENLGINIELRVISTIYNVLLNRYDSIDLGEKSEKISSSSVQTGDNVSSLSNDVGYTDVTTVNKLITKTITADLIQAKNAKLSKAQIEELQTARIKCTGIIEATQFELDTLIAKMLTADNAVIKQTLEAGTVKVKGDITVTSGSIKIESTESGTVFNVDRDGNVTANSVHITGGELNINDTFTVTPDGILTAQGADIQGRIEAESGLIAKFNIESDTIEGNTYNRIWSGSINTSNYVLVSPGYNAIITNLDSENSHNWAFAAGSNFGVDNQGNLYAKNAFISGKIESDLGKIAGFEITETNIHTINKELGSDKSVYLSSSGEYSIIENLDNNYHYWSLVIDNLFGVTREGEIFAKSVDLTGKITATSGKIAGFEISNDTFKLIANNIEISPTKLSYGPNEEFTVLPDGTVVIQNSNDPTNPDYKSITLNSSGLIATSITVNNADINLGHIGGFTIGEEAIYKDISSFDAEGNISGVYLGPDGLRIGKNLKIYPNGRIMSGSKDYNESLNYVIGDYCIHLGSLYKCISNTSGTWDSSKWEEVAMTYFGVDDTGKLTASSAEIIGNITAESGYIGKSGEGFTITSKAIYNGFSDPDSLATDTGVYLGTDGIRLGKKVTQQKIVTFGNLAANNYITKSIEDSDTEYIGAEFILSYDSYPEDRYLTIREQDSNSENPSNIYEHEDNPNSYLLECIGKTKDNNTIFDINIDNFTFLNFNNSILWNQDGSFIGTNDMYLYFDDIDLDHTYPLKLKIYYYNSEEDWINDNNPQDYLQDIIVQRNILNITIPVGTSPWVKIKLIKNPDSQKNINVLPNCLFKSNIHKLVLLPANSTSISFVAEKYYYIRMKSVSILESPLNVNNIKLTLKVLPGFLVTPDGMMNAYNAKIYGSLIGDVRIVGGSISIAGSNSELKTWIGTNSSDTSATLEELRNICIILGLDYSRYENEDDIIYAIQNLIADVGLGTLTGGQLSQIYNIAGIDYSHDNAVFKVDENGNLYAKSSEIAGKITATSGQIGGFNIWNTNVDSREANAIIYGNIGQDNSVVMSPGYTSIILTLNSSSLTWAFTAGQYFGVTTDGVLFSKSGYIGGFEITSSSLKNNPGQTTYRGLTLQSYTSSSQSVPEPIDSDYEATVETDSISVYKSIMVTESIRAGQSLATSSNPSISVYFADYQSNDNNIGSNSYLAKNGLITVGSYYGGSGGADFIERYMSKIPARDIPGIMYIQNSQLLKNYSTSLSNCRTNPIFGFGSVTITDNTLTINTGLSGVFIAGVCLRENSSGGVWNSDTYLAVDYSNGSGSIVIKVSDWVKNKSISYWYIGYKN